MITKMTVKNFKSWKEAREVRFAPITALFGSNSSGKTSLLQLLLMLKQTTESPDRSQVLNLGDDKGYVELGTYNDIVFGHKGGTPLQWHVAWKLNKDLKIEDPEHKGSVLFKAGNIGFEASLEQNGSGRVVVDHMSYDFSSWQFGMKRKSKEKNEYELFSESSPNAPFFEFRRIFEGLHVDKSFCYAKCPFYCIVKLHFRVKNTLCNYRVTDMYIYIPSRETQEFLIHALSDLFAVSSGKIF